MEGTVARLVTLFWKHWNQDPNTWMQKMVADDEYLGIPMIYRQGNYQAVDLLFRSGAVRKILQRRGLPPAREGFKKIDLHGETMQALLNLREEHMERGEREGRQAGGGPAWTKTMKTDTAFLALGWDPPGVGLRFTEADLTTKSRLRLAIDNARGADSKAAAAAGKKKKGHTKKERLAKLNKEKDECV